MWALAPLECDTTLIATLKMFTSVSSEILDSHLLKSPFSCGISYLAVVSQCIAQQKRSLKGKGVPRRGGVRLNERHLNSKSMT